jgi:riboflavin biosynthesis pyrimidine reductase
MTLSGLSQAGFSGPPVWLDPHWLIEPIWTGASEPSTDRVRAAALPPELRSRYASTLDFPLRGDRPTIVDNFVSTLDGVVALDRTGASGGSEISGRFEPDRFLMGLLRAASDAVLVGAGTVRASRTHGWTPEHAHRPSLRAFSDWRRALGLKFAAPATVIVTASGGLEHQHFPADPDAPVIIATTVRGGRRLRRLPRPGHVEIVSVAEGDSIPIDDLVAFLQARGFGLVLAEGGPAVFGQLLAARVVDEVFLTLAPQLAGRSAAAERLSLVEGADLTADTARWARLRSVMRSNDHLFVRYQLSPPGRKDLS